MITSQLLDEVLRCVGNIGYEATLEGVRKLQSQTITFSDERVNKVVMLVCEEINISTHEIVYGSGRKNERKFAIGLCAYLLHSEEFFDIPMNDVADFLGKEAQLLYKHSKIVQRLRPNNTVDKKYLEIKTSVEQRLIPFIQKTNKV